MKSLGHEDDPPDLKFPNLKEYTLRLKGLISYTDSILKNPLNDPPEKRWKELVSILHKLESEKKYIRSLLAKQVSNKLSINQRIEIYNNSSNLEIFHGYMEGRLFLIKGELPNLEQQVINGSYT